MRPSVFNKQVDNIKNYLLSNNVIIRNIVDSNDDNYSIIYCSYQHNRFKVIISQYDNNTLSVFCIFYGTDEDYPQHIDSDFSVSIMDVPTGDVINPNIVQSIELFKNFIQVYTKRRQKWKHFISIIMVIVITQ